MIMVTVMVRKKLLVIPHAHGLGLGDDNGNSYDHGLGDSDGEEKVVGDTSCSWSCSQAWHYPYVDYKGQFKQIGFQL